MDFTFSRSFSIFLFVFSLFTSRSQKLIEISFTFKFDYFSLSCMYFANPSATTGYDKRSILK